MACSPPTAMPTTPCTTTAAISIAERTLTLPPIRLRSTTATGITRPLAWDSGTEARTTLLRTRCITHRSQHTLAAAPGRRLVRRAILALARYRLKRDTTEAALVVVVVAERDLRRHRRRP